MSASNDGPVKGPSPSVPGAGGKKPSALLDLQATEVKEEAAKTPSSTPSSTPSGGAGAAASAAAASSGSQPKASAASASSVPSAGGASGGETGASGKTSAAPQQTASATDAGAASTGTKAFAGSRKSEPGAPPPAPPAGRPATRGPGIGGVLAYTMAGLVGGLMALLAADTVGPQLGLTGVGQGPAATAALQRRLADIESRIPAKSGASEASAALLVSLGAAEKRISELEKAAGRIAALEAENNRLASETKALSETLATRQTAEDPRVERLQQQLSALSAAAGTDPERGRIPQLAAVTGKLADLESTIATQLGQVRKTLGQEIDQRLAPVAEASEAARAGTQRIDRDVAALKSEAARLQQSADAGQAIDARLEQAVRAIEQQAAALKVAIDGVRSDFAAQMQAVARPADVASAVAPVAQKVGQLEANLKDVVRSEEDRKASAERIVLSLELANLRRAVDRGGAFVRELQDVRKIAGTKLDLAPLAKFETTGVATPPDLVAEFRGVANAILDAEATTADASVVDRLLAGAKSIVRVRRVDHDAGDKSAEAIVGRMQSALTDGELGRVLEESKALGERAQVAARPWLDKVAARQSVETAIARVEEQLKTTIAGQAAPAKGVN